MDGSKTRHYRGIQQVAKRRPSNQRFSARAAGVQLDEFSEPLTFAEIAPAPPSGPPDNLLLAKVKNTPITIELALVDEINDQLQDGDTIELVINGTPLGQAKEVLLDPFIDTPKVTILLALDDHKDLPEGRVEINYIIHFRSNGTEVRNGPPGQFFTTDYTPPGLPFLGQLVFSDEVLLNGVTEAALIGTDPDQYLPAQVPGYTDLTGGDHITGIVGGRKETLDTIDVGNGNIELRFRRDFIVEEEDGRIAFSWTVTDRATNEAATAPSATKSSGADSTQASRQRHWNSLLSSTHSRSTSKRPRWGSSLRDPPSFTNS